MPSRGPNTFALDAYQLRLPAFEGPLDVLLRLIEREQLPISEVSLVAIFDQFVAFLDVFSASSPEVIADFVAVAGRLAVLKSRSLLPHPPMEQDEPDEEDLVRQLAEYRAVKAAAELLDGRQRSGGGAYERGDGVLVPEAPPGQLALQPPAALAKAIRRWITRIPVAPIPFPFHRVVSLREMIARIVSGLETHPRLPFSHVCAGVGSRQEIGVAFLALLTLLRRQAAVATQDQLFGPITIMAVSTSPAPLPLDHVVRRDDVRSFSA